MLVSAHACCDQSGIAGLHCRGSFWRSRALTYGSNNRFRNSSPVGLEPCFAPIGDWIREAHNSRVGGPTREGPERNKGTKGAPSGGILGVYRYRSSRVDAVFFRVLWTGGRRECPHSMRWSFSLMSKWIRLRGIPLPHQRCDGTRLVLSSPAHAETDMVGGQ